MQDSQLTTISNNTNILTGSIKEPEIKNQLSYLSEQHLLLDEKLNMLLERLRPVCSNLILADNKHSGLSEVKQNNYSDVSKLINDESQNVKNMIEKIGFILSILEV